MKLLKSSDEGYDKLYKMIENACPGQAFVTGKHRLVKVNDKYHLSNLCLLDIHDGVIYNAKACVFEDLKWVCLLVSD